jgi:hypothetical protein
MLELGIKKCAGGVVVMARGAYAGVESNRKFDNRVSWYTIILLIKN